MVKGEMQSLDITHLSSVVLLEVAENLDVLVGDELRARTEEERGEGGREASKSEGPEGGERSCGELERQQNVLKLLVRGRHTLIATPLRPNRPERPIRWM